MPKKKNPKFVSVFDNDDNPNFKNYEHTQIWNSIKELAERISKLEGSWSTWKWAFGIFLPLIITLLLYLMLKI